MDTNKAVLTEKDALDIAWKYFQQHAQQRISYFNFFILFSSIMTTAMIATLSPQFNLNLLGIGIGLMQSLIAYVFIKIDQRNRHLTKIGENAIIEIEQTYNLPNQINCASVRVFNKEGKQTKEDRGAKAWHSLISSQISHSASYKLIYFAFAIAGFVGAATSFYEFRSKITNKTSQSNIKVFIDYSSTRRALPISDIKPFIIQNSDRGK